MQPTMKGCKKVSTNNSWRNWHNGVVSRSLMLVAEETFKILIMSRGLVMGRLISPSEVLWMSLEAPESHLMNVYNGIRSKLLLHKMHKCIKSHANANAKCQMGCPNIFLLLCPASKLDMSSDSSPILACVNGFSLLLAKFVIYQAKTS